MSTGVETTTWLAPEFWLAGVDVRTGGTGVNPETELRVAPNLEAATDLELATGSVAWLSVSENVPGERSTAFAAAFAVNAGPVRVPDLTSAAAGTRIAECKLTINENLRR